MKRCTTVQENNSVNWAKFGTQTNPFGFHCIETLISSNFNFLPFNRRELSGENSTLTLRKPWNFWAKLKRHWGLPYMCWISRKGKFHLNQILNLKKGKRPTKKNMVCSSHNQHLSLFSICNKTGFRWLLPIDMADLTPGHFQNQTFLSTSAVTHTLMVDLLLLYLIPSLCIVFTSTYMQFVIYKCYAISLSFVVSDCALSLVIKLIQRKFWWQLLLVTVLQVLLF